MTVESDVRKRLGKLPKTLRETYSEIYQRILLQEGSDPGLAQKAIMWVMCSCRPLQPDELAFLVSSQESKESGVPCGLSIEVIFQVCRNLLTHDLQSNVVQFAHLTVWEFLTYDVNVKHSLSTYNMNYMAAKFCLSRLGNPGFWAPGPSSATAKCSASTSISSPGARIAKYIVRYWAIHVQLCSDEKEDTGLLASIVKFYGSLCVPSKEYVQWVESATNDDGYYSRQTIKEISEPIVPLLASCAFGFGETLIDMDGLSNLNTEIRQRALYLAIEKGHHRIVRALLRNKVGNKARGGYHGYGLQAAASRGHKKVVELLLQDGADVNAQGGRYGGALQAAAINGHEMVAELLLQHGADLNAQDDLHGSALRAAATNKHLKVIKLILQNTPEVKIDVDGENLLFTFIKARSEKTVDLLLENGAKIVATDKDGNTTLIFAARSEHERVAEVIQADVRATDGDEYTPQHTEAQGGSQPDFEDNRSILSDSDSNYTGISLFSGYFGPSSNTSAPPVPQNILKTVEDSIVGVLASSSAVSTVLSEAFKKHSQTTVNRRLCRALTEFSKTVRGLQTTKRLSQAELTVLRNLTGKNALDAVAFKIGSIFVPKSNHLKLNDLQNCGQLQKWEIVDSYLQSGSDASGKLSEVERPDDMKDPVDSDDSDDTNDSGGSNSEEEFLSSVESDWPIEQILDYFKSKEILGIFEGAVVKRFTRFRHNPKTLQVSCTKLPIIMTTYLSRYRRPIDKTKKTNLQPKKLSEASKWLIDIHGQQDLRRVKRISVSR